MLTLVGLTSLSAASSMALKLVERCMSQIWLRIAVAGSTARAEMYVAKREVRRRVRRMDIVGVVSGDLVYGFFS